MLAIADYLRSDLVLKLKATDQPGALRELMDAVEAAGMVDDPEDFFRRIQEREQESSTAIGLGVAIPHIRLDSLERIFIAVGISTDGIDCNAPDDASVHLVFMVGATQDHAEYLKLVARISWLVRNDQLRMQLFRTSSAEELFELLSDY